MEPGTAFEPSPEPTRDDPADVARLLYLHSKPWGQRYEEWGQEHPILRTGAELGANYALDELGVPILRYVGAGHMADILDQMRRLGSGGFGEGAEYIKDPKLKLEKDTSMSTPTTDLLNLKRTEDNKYLGYLSVSPDPDTRQLHVNMATNIFGGEKQYGTGQYMHLIRSEAQNRYPDMEWLRFFRTSGAGPRNKNRFEDVTMPIKSYDEMSPEGKRMYDRFVSMYGKPIRRVRLGGAETGAPPEDVAEAGRVAEQMSARGDEPGHEIRQTGPTQAESLADINRYIAAGNERLRSQLTPEQTAAQLTPEQMRMRRYGDEIANQVGWSGESDAERTLRLRKLGLE